MDLWVWCRSGSPRGTAGTTEIQRKPAKRTFCPSCSPLMTPMTSTLSHTATPTRLSVALCHPFHGAAPTWVDGLSPRLYTPNFPHCLSPSSSCRFTDLQRYLHHLEGKALPFVQRELLGRSLLHRRLDLLRITNETRSTNPQGKAKVLSSCCCGWHPSIPSHDNGMGACPH